MAAGRRWSEAATEGQLLKLLGGLAAEAMADSYSRDSEPTTRTLLRRVLDTADPRTPRRPRSARTEYVRALPQHKSNLREWAMGSRADPVWRRKLSLGEEQSPGL